VNAVALAWELPAVRGAVALAVFVVLFVVARLRWRKRDSDQGPPDIGLD
jgi:hypothetical protein